MESYSYSNFPDHALFQELDASDSCEWTNTARQLAQLGEVQARKLYLKAGYSSMVAYCVGARHYTEDVAFKRSRAARTARRFPAIYPALADNSLSLSSVLMLKPHLSAETADELLAAAANKTTAQLEVLLAERFPRPDLPAIVQAIGPEGTGAQLAVRPVSAGADPDGAGRQCPASSPPVSEPVAEPAEALAARPVTAESAELAVRPVSAKSAQLAVRPVEPAVSRPRVTPLAPQRFALQVTLGQEAHDDLRWAQALLGHAVPSGDLAQVVGRALKALVRELERSKFAAGSRTRPGRASANARQVPAAVKREVWQRDGGRCTFTSEKGHRCEARTRLELDHVTPVARGGQPTVDGLRLLCRAHNQHAADVAFGRGFMDEKRQAARHARSEARTRGAAAAATPRATATAGAEARRTRVPTCSQAERNAALEVIPWLRGRASDADEVSPGGTSAAAASTDPPAQEGSLSPT